jgi:hypothetical protein
MQRGRWASWAFGSLVVSPLLVVPGVQAAEEPPRAANPQPSTEAAPPSLAAPLPAPLPTEASRLPTEPSPLPAEPSPSSEKVAPKEAPPERRSGFTFGLSGGLLTGAARGYPNDVAKIGFAEYRTETGVGVSSGGALWFGGALSDWLNVGIGVSGGGFERSGLRLSSAAFQARVELFPLFHQGGVLRDLGVLLAAGTGVTVIQRGKESVAEGVGTSAVGGGVFYEPWRWWRLTFGPQLEYLYQFSDSMRAHTVVLGVRTAFYGGP